MSSWETLKFTWFPIVADAKAPADSPELSSFQCSGIVQHLHGWPIQHLAEFDALRATRLGCRTVSTSAVSGEAVGCDLHSPRLERSRIPGPSRVRCNKTANQTQVAT